MITRAVVFIAALALAAPAGAQTKPPARPAAPAPKPAQQGGDFDARNPQDLIALLAHMGAQATVAGRAEDTVSLRVTTPAYAFSAQYAGCNAQARKCRALALSTQSDARTATVAELNAFNQTSLTCRVWQGKDGKPRVMYSALVFSGDTRAEMETHLGAWQGCLTEFGDFLKNPTAYLAVAP